MALFNELESELLVAVIDDADDEVVDLIKRRGKHKSLQAELRRIKIIHELPEHEQTCTSSCRRHVTGEGTSKLLEIVPRHIRVIRHIRKVYDCRDCKTAPVIADKPAQLIEKSLASAFVDAQKLQPKGKCGRMTSGFSASALRTP